jgi:hypothetical protein
MCALDFERVVIGPHLTIPDKSTVMPGNWLALGFLGPCANLDSLAQTLFEFPEARLGL